MFKPTYRITNTLLAHIKRINILITELNTQRFPHVVLVEFEKDARAVSTHASTSIEGNPLPLTEVKKILKTKPAYIRTSELEILNYNQALQDINKKNEDAIVLPSLPLILHIQKQVTKGLLPDYESGALRQKPVVVNDPGTGNVVFLPPDVEHVKDLLEDLILFVNENKSTIDPLILAGIFHKQMVIIHPFMDGNGRTSRLATKVLLAHMGLNTFNLFSFENYYNRNVTRYFQTVGEKGNFYDLVDQIDFTEWLEYFTEGIIDELLRVQGLLTNVAISPDTELQPYHVALLEFIKHKGFVSDKDYATLTERAKATRAIDFNKLINLGLIERKGKGKATYYVLKEK